MTLIGECRGWDVETEMLNQWQEYRDLFPVIPMQSRFNRRRRGLIHAFNLIWQVVLQCLDIAQDCQCVIDSLPLPVVQFHLVPSSSASSNWRANNHFSIWKHLDKLQTALVFQDTTRSR